MWGQIFVFFCLCTIKAKGYKYLSPHFIHLLLTTLFIINKGCGSKSVYFQRIASIWRYTDSLPHPLICIIKCGQKIMHTFTVVILLKYTLFSDYFIFPKSDVMSTNFRADLYCKMFLVWSESTWSCVQCRLSIYNDNANGWYLLTKQYYH